MPTYHYRCTADGYEFDVHQSFSDAPLTACPKCGQPVKRVIHASPIVFKGSGWYITDSRPTTESSGGVQDAAKVAEKHAPESAKADAPAPSEPTSATSGDSK